MACTYTEGYNYQENYFSKYHAKKNDTYLITNEYMFSKGDVVKSSDSDYVNADAVHVYRLPDLFSLLPHKLNNYIGKYKGFYNLIESISPDIIFTHNCQFQDLKQVARYCKAHPNIKLFVDNHADFSNSARNWLTKNILYPFWWRSCAKSVEPYAIKFYGVLPARVDFLINVYKLDPKKCELLVMGADDDEVKRAAETGRGEVREKHGIKDSDILIVTGGKIDLFKQQTLMLMKAVKKIDRQNLKLIVFGSVVKELKEKLESMVDGQKIQYVPWLDSAASYDYFAAADLVVFPGRHSVYWEQAAGQGKPMICKYWEGTTHVDVGGNAVFLKEDSVDAICDAILSVINNTSVLNRMKTVAKVKGMENFSYRFIAAKAICTA